MSRELGTSPTEVLAGEAAKLSLGDLPTSVVLVAKQCLLDAIGVGLAGAASEPARLVAAVALEDAPEGPCTLLGSASRTNATGAALANGTAIHALDYDDMSVPLCGHPTAPLLPALLALGEQLGASGAALLSAFVAGYEGECRIGESVDPGHYNRGYHATATVGTVGAAIAVGHLLGLGAEDLEIAIGIAATQAAGLKSMFGTMCKPLHAGRAAASGILAARLARDGFTSARDAIAREQGFASTLGDGFKPELLEQPFGSPWYILGNLFKFHAACYFTHGAINAAIELRREGLDLGGVEQIELLVPRQHLSVCNIEAPVTGLEGKFSLRFATAVALARGSADESCFTDSTVRDTELVDLQRRIDVVPDDALGTYDTVLIIRGQGSTRRLENNSSKTAWSTTPDEQSAALLAKFHSLLDQSLGPDASDELAGQLLSLETLENVRALRPLLTGASDGA